MICITMYVCSETSSKEKTKPEKTGLMKLYLTSTVEYFVAPPLTMCPEVSVVSFSPYFLRLGEIRVVVCFGVLPAAPNNPAVVLVLQVIVRSCLLHIDLDYRCAHDSSFTPTAAGTLTISANY